MINQKALTNREIGNIIRNMLKENSPINLLTLTREKFQAIFSTFICIKIYGKYDKNDAYCNKTRNL